MKSCTRCKQLEKALKAFMRDAEGLARHSYAIGGVTGLFNESIWEAADPIAFRIWKAAQRLFEARAKKNARNVRAVVKGCVIKLSVKKSGAAKVVSRARKVP